MYKDILVYADASKASQIRFAAASLLAKSFKAHVTALHVSVPPYIPVDVGAAGVPPEVIEWQEEFEEDQATAARKAVETFRKNARVDVEFRSIRGDMATAVTMSSRYADLIVVSQPDAAAGEQPTVDDLPETAILSAACPALITPRAGRVTSIGKRVLVAWNNTREAARTLSDAIPLMSGAQSVTLLEINAEHSAFDKQGRIDVVKHLARHKIKAKVVTATAKDVGAAILTRAKSLKADLIVMGGYGHSRLREFVLGGVTAHVLKNTTVPVLMSH